jgi:hypothetical protein
MFLREKRSLCFEQHNKMLISRSQIPNYFCQVTDLSLLDLTYITVHNKQLWTANKRWSSNLGVEQGEKILHFKNSCYEMLQRDY